MKFCPNCGEKIEEGADVCTKCGYSLKKQRKASATNGRYASFGERFLALIIDSILIGLVCTILGVYKPNMSSFSFSDFNTLAGLLGVVITAVYFAYMESSSTQGTVGKMIMHIKVESEDHKPITFTNALGRYFAKWVSSILLLGYIAMLFDNNGQCWHDKIAHTYVVRY